MLTPVRLNIIYSKGFQTKSLGLQRVKARLYNNMLYFVSVWRKGRNCFFLVVTLLLSLCVIITPSRCSINFNLKWCYLFFTSNGFTECTSLVLVGWRNTLISQGHYVSGCHYSLLYSYWWHQRFSITQNIVSKNIWMASMFISFTRLL